MRRHWKKLALLSAACVASALFSVLAYDPQPSYQGRKLSEWIMCQDTNAERDALIHMGTNALPYLVNWACPDDPQKWKMTILSTSLKYQSGPTQSNLTVRLATWLNEKYLRAESANRALGLLGTNAYPALPQLVQRIAVHSYSLSLRARYATTAVLYGSTLRVREVQSMEQSAFNHSNPDVRRAATNVHELVTILTSQ